MTRLPAPRGRDCTTGDHSTALAINEGGVVIGATYTDDCYNRCPRAAIWTYKP